MQYRIQKAKELMLTTHLKSYEIAELVGFSDESYFSRCFKKITGMSPNEYRRNKSVSYTHLDVYKRQKLGCWWHFLHERFWNIRGMENLMFDYYDAMDELKLLGKKLLEYYKVIVDRFCELGFDGIFTSDDLGHQTGPMMSPEIFHELYYPLYKEFIAYVHGRGMHFFLHSCGDNTLLMDCLLYTSRCV